MQDVDDIHRHAGEVVGKLFRQTGTSEKFIAFHAPIQAHYRVAWKPQASLPIHLTSLMCISDNGDMFCTSHLVVTAQNVETGLFATPSAFGIRQVDSYLIGTTLHDMIHSDSYCHTEQAMLQKVKPFVNQYYY